MRSAHFIFLAILYLQARAITLTYAQSRDDVFGFELAYIRSMPIDAYGRESIVREMELLISRHPSDKRIPEVMLYISHLYTDYSLEDVEVYPDIEIALEWVRRAVDSAEIGSLPWIEAQFRLARITRKDDLSLALRILGEIENNTEDLVALSKVYDEKIETLIRARDLPGAIALYEAFLARDKKLLEDMNFSGHTIPGLEGGVMNDILKIERHTTFNLVDAIQSRSPHLSNFDRELYLYDLLRTFPLNPKLQEEALRALDRIHKKAVVEIEAKRSESTKGIIEEVPLLSAAMNEEQEGWDSVNGEGAEAVFGGKDSKGIVRPIIIGLIVIGLASIGFRRFSRRSRR